MGKVILVGAGPGDPQLLTIKGKKYLQQADCIIYDRLIGKELLRLAKSECEFIFVGKENHHHTMKQEKINELLVEKARQHDLVVRLKGGDPYVFGRGGEEAICLNENGISVDVVPGISSSVAALAYAGIPITHRGVSKGFHVITAHSKKDEIADIDYSLLVDPKETCVFLMGLGHVEEIAEGLMKVGRSQSTPVAVISNGTIGKQKKCIGTLSNIGKLVRENELDSPAIIVVGDVVQFEKELSYFEKRPLFGKKYFIPYIKGCHYSFSGGWVEETGNALGDRLQKMGADILAYRTGRIASIQCDLKIINRLSEKDYIIFTSQNAVYSFMWNLTMNKMDMRSLGEAKIAVVGKKTAKALESFGIYPDLISSRKTAEGLGAVLLDYVSEDTQVIWFAARETSKGLEESLSGKCILSKVICYENIEEAEEVTALMEKELAACDGVFFTSGSNVRRSIEIFGDKMPKDVYSIGATCSKCLKESGITDYQEAESPSYDGLIELLWKTES